MSEDVSKLIEKLKNNFFCKYQGDCIGDDESCFQCSDYCMDYINFEDVISDRESESPCDSCGKDCDGWDARYCCTLCMFNGLEDCENCDPMDI